MPRVALESNKNHCPGCGQEIDESYCWCGIHIDEHKYEEHLLVPLGCNCSREQCST